MKTKTTKKKAVRRPRVIAKTIPLSSATNAYDLVTDVMRAIRDEPKRADMRCYARFKGPHVGGPACGTVGCFAGWVNLLAGVSLETIRSVSYPDSDASDILGRHGVNYMTAGKDMCSYVFNAGEGGDIVGVPGTRRYARSVVARIRHFRDFNAAGLKAKAIAR